MHRYEAKHEYLCLDLIKHGVCLYEGYNFWNVNAKFMQGRCSIPEGVLKVSLQDFVNDFIIGGHGLSLLLIAHELIFRQ